MYFVYMLRCRGGSLYTGIAADIERGNEAIKAKPPAHFQGRRGRPAVVRRA